MSSELRSLEERSRSVVWRYGTNAKFTLCRCCRLFSNRGQAPNCIFVSFTSVLQHDKLHKLYTIHQDCIGAKNRPQQLQLKHPAEDKKHSSHHFPNPLCLEIIVTGYVSLFFSSAVIWNLASRHCFGRTSPLKWVPVHSHAKKKGCRCDRLHQGVGKRMCRTCKKEKKKPQTNWAHEVSAYTTEWGVRTRLVFHSHPCRIMWVKASENGKWMNAAYAFVCCQDSYLHGSVRHIQRTKCSQVTFVSCCGVRLSRMFSICRGGREMNGILCFVLWYQGLDEAGNNQSVTTRALSTNVFYY